MDKNKKWVDPVVEEVRERGRSFTARFNNDPKKIMEELRRIKESSTNQDLYVSEVKIVKKAS